MYAEQIMYVCKDMCIASLNILVVDSVMKHTCGMVFGFHRAMDTADVMVGIPITTYDIWFAQKDALDLSKFTFQIIVQISLLPAFLVVLSLTYGSERHDSERIMHCVEVLTSQYGPIISCFF